MTKPNTHQLLLTRFNIRTSGVGYSEEQSPDWLEERFDLFGRYCAPSIAAQTEEDFDWIIFCDEHTPPEILERIRAYDSRIRIALFVYRPPAPSGGDASQPVSPVIPSPARDDKVLSTLQVFPHVRPDAEIVVASRVDNDDALSRHAMKRVREHIDQFIASRHDQWLYNPMLGYKFDHQTRRLYPAEKHNSAFLTMFERKIGDVRPRGPFAGNHSLMHEQYPSYQDVGARLWLMVIHGGNVLNGIGARDVEVPIDNLDDGFSFLR